VKEIVPDPPPEVFNKVTYESPAGRLAAYLSPDPMDGMKHPAIVWITGGDCNSIGDVWTDAPASNDQTAAAFRKAGVIMMFPSLRGGNDNPGTKEGFLGEVDDVLAAAAFLAKQDYVAADRIYLGGHSTGGTLVLLVGEDSDRFRAVFSFGPADNVAGYPAEFVPFDTSNPRELELRSPGLWLASIKAPVFVIEGTVDSNLESLQAMARASTNPQAHFLSVRGANHFSVLAPVCKLLADKIVHDDGASQGLSLTEQELNAVVANAR
jgi:dipeptidyl aminopeptidase/acylaminoacyl peptidase